MIDEFRAGVQFRNPMDESYVKYVWLQSPPGPPLKWYQKIRWDLIALWAFLVAAVAFFAWVYIEYGIEGLVALLPFLILGFLIGGKR